MNKNALNNCIIRNSKTCDEYGNMAHETVFSIERDKKGWDSVSNISLYGVSGGIAFLMSDNSNPSLTRTNVFSNVDTSIYTEVVLKYKYIKNSITSIANKGKLQFTTQSSSIFIEENSVDFDLISDGKWHTYRINMAPIKGWIGYVNNLKIFFTTNGSSGDEIFLHSIKIQSNNFYFCINECFEDKSEVIIGDNFDLQLLGDIPQGYSTLDTSNNKIVKISTDIQSFNNKVVSLINTIGTTTGPSIIRSFSESISEGYFICRFNSSNLSGNIKLQSNIFSNISIFDLKIDSSGVLKYKQALSYYNFNINHNILPNSWNDLLVTFNSISNLINVTLNGILIGKDIPYIISGVASGLRFENNSNSINTLLLDDVIVINTIENNLNCPGLGTQGKCIGQEVSFIKLDIIENINNSLIVNINEYGDEVIKLPPSIGLNPYEIRKLLELEIGKVDFGGYPKVEVNFIDNKFEIRSGTYGFDSKIVVKKHETSLLSNQLGFTDLVGMEISTNTVGVPSSRYYEFSSKIKSCSRDLIELIEDSKRTNLGITYNTENSLVTIGSNNADKMGRKNTIDGTGSTIIDFYHRATEEGKIKEVYFHGILPTEPGIKVNGSIGYVSGNIFHTGILNLQEYGVKTGDILSINTPGYSNNGEYRIQVTGESGNIELLDNIELSPSSNLIYEIHNIPKVKHFRPKKDGSLVLLNEVSIGMQGVGLYTRTPDTHKVLVDWYVHRGDYIAIYNATKLYIGNDQTEVSEFTYIKYDEDSIGTILLKPIEGYGIGSLGLLGTDILLKNKAIYDIDLLNNISLDYLDIFLEQTLSGSIEYNLCAAVGNGLTLSTKVEGTHIHSVFNTSTALHENISHPNIAYNVQSLTDNIKYASNGYLGSFETTYSGAVYFYISGDGEFAHYVYENGILIYDSLEFPLAGNKDPEYIFDYQSDPFDITLNFSRPVNLNKIKIYFKEAPNADGYWLEYYDPLKVGFDGSIPGFQTIGNGNESYFTKVILNDLVLDTSILEPNDVLMRHFDKKFIGYLDINNTEDAIPYLGLQSYPYTVLEKQFTPIKTQSLNWHCNYHSSTKISEIEVFNSTSTESSLDSLIEVYVSMDGDYFQRVDNYIIDNDKVRFTIGIPVRYIRVVIEPLGTIKLSKLIGITTQDNTRFIDGDTNYSTTSVDIGAKKGTTSRVQKLKIKNLNGQTADLSLSFEVDEVNKDILIKSPLNNLMDITTPQIGPGGFILLDNNFDLPTVSNVAINADCYGLKNISIGKSFYISQDFNSEYDSFYNNVDLTKWSTYYTYFPSGDPGNFLGLKFPGFGIFPEPGPTGNPENSRVAIAKLVSRWKPLGSFSSSIVCNYDSRSGKANPMTSAIGIRDSLGREIVIKKDIYRCNPSGPSNNRNYAEYNIYDSLLGTIETKRSFCIQGCGADNIYGTEDDLIEYNLTVTRILDSGRDLLRFSYIDTVNGRGLSEFDGNKYIEINLQALSTPLSGEIRIVIYNYWNSTGVDNISGTPGTEGTFIRINRFYFGGESTYSGKYYHFNDGANTIGNNGEVGVDNYSLTTRERLVAVDLGKLYSLDTLQNYTKTSRSLWSIVNTQFSNTNTLNPEQVSWGNTGPNEVRWILIASPTTTGTAIKYLDILRIYPDITDNSTNFLNITEWVYLSNVLTDNNKDTHINQLDYPIIAIGLENQFRLSNFKILDPSSSEYKRSGQPFSGWTEDCYFSTSYSLYNNPSLVDWNIWSIYNEENKDTSSVKWFAFKNEIFNLQGGGTKQYISEFIVSTKGLDYSNIGQVNDRVDCTEYSKWFNLDYKYNKNIAELSSEDVLYSGYLYGSSSTTLGSVSNECLDNNEFSSTKFIHIPVTLWRCFGIISPISTDTNDFITYSGSNGLITISGVESQSYTIEYTPQVIDGIELVVTSTARGIPNTIEIQTFSGIDPLQNSSWNTIYTETNLATYISESEDYIFNNGESYIYKFSPPIISSGIRLKITDSIFFGENTEITEITEFKILQETSTIKDNSLLITNDPNFKVGGSRSLKITCSGTDPLLITTGGAFNLLPDSNWSIQDYFSFYLKIDNFTEIDFSNSKIRLGNNSSIFYEWTLDTLSTEDFNNFKLIKLKFLNSTSKGEGVFNINLPDRADLESKVDFINELITFLQLEIKLISNNSLVNIWLDNFHIIREDFNIIGQYSTTTYLNNREVLFFPIKGFDARKGFFEVIIIPDWKNDSHRSIKDYEVYTLFNIYNGPGESIIGVYSLIRGFSIIINTIGENYILDFGRINIIEQYIPFKLSLAWDSSGNILDSIANCSVKLHINDLLIGESTQKWNFLNNGNSCFYLGSIAPSSDVSLNTLNEYGSTVSNKLLPKISSLTGALENFMLSSDTRKVGFNNIQTLKDKLYISLDGINYYSGVSNNLPITIAAIPNLSEITVWIKADLPEILDNISRTGYLKARWKLV